MNISQLIQQRLQGEFSIYYRNGQKAPSDEVREKYLKIRNYLNTFHQTNNEIIAIKLLKDVDYFLCILAALDVGIPYIPMKTDFPDHRVQQIREESNFTLLIDENKLNEIYGGKIPHSNFIRSITPDTYAYVLFTSGSTGKPKGVIIQRKAINNFFNWLTGYFANVKEFSPLLQVTEFTFDISLVDIGMFIKNNTEVHFSQYTQDIFTLAHEIETKKIQFISTVPNNLNMLLHEMIVSRANYSSLKELIIAGARFSYGLYQKCEQHFKGKARIHNAYGPTECTVYSHVKEIVFNQTTDCFDTVIAIGRELPNVESHIVRDGDFVTDSKEGELVLSGIQMMKEYINNPERTKEAFIQIQGRPYYKTGDVAFKNNHGDYFVVGRNDDTIKYRGFRINLLDIDSYIQKLPMVEDSVTIAIETENLDNKTVGFIRTNTSTTVKEIKASMAQYLLEYQIPEKIIFVTEYPVNNSGKVCKKTLKENFIKGLYK